MPEADFEAPLVALQKRIDDLAQWPGEPAKERKPEKGEKAEERERLDKAWAQSQERLAARLKFERMLQGLVFIVPKSSVAALLRERFEMVPPARAAGR